MLVKFYVENFLSFKDEVCLDMVASAKLKDHQNHVEEIEEGKKISVLRSAVIYGANGAGKSNLVKAIAFARDLILRGTQADEKIRVIPFKIDEKSEKEPCKFEFVFKFQGKIYTYGAVLSADRVIEEWLYFIAKTREAKLFERETHGNGNVTVKPGTSLATNNQQEKDFIQLLARGTRPNQLFLSKAIENNVALLKPVIEWFKNVLTVITPNASANIIEGLKQDELFREQMGSFLKIADTGVETVEVEETRIDIQNFKELKGFFQPQWDKLSSKNREEITSEINRISQEENMLLNENSSNNEKKDRTKTTAFLTKIVINHKAKNGRLIPFEAEEESDGTRRLMDLMPVLYLGDKMEKVFVIDELERSLHPRISRFFVEKYLNTDFKYSGQIIFTTHETHLMDLELLRKDEIVFIEKNKENSSDIYSLVEFKPRNDLKVEKYYMQGRYGGIPFIGDFSKLGIGEKAAGVNDKSEKKPVVNKKRPASKKLVKK